MIRGTLGLLVSTCVACAAAPMASGPEPAERGELADGGAPSPDDGGVVDGGEPVTPPPDAGGPDAMGRWSDLPEAPLVEGSAPAQSAAHFEGDAASGSGPCLVEPEPGSLIPKNWLRPRFRWNADAAHNLFELRVTVPNQTRPLVVYTSERSYTMSAALWRGLTGHSSGHTLSVTVRGAQVTAGQRVGAPTAPTFAGIELAPVQTAGQIVYWTTTHGSALKGFHVGDETVRELLRPSQANAQCIGCHTSTPDGRHAAFSASRDAIDGNPSHVAHRTVDGSGEAPTYLSDAARALLRRVPQQLPFFSPAWWSDERKLQLSMLTVNDRWEIAWTWLAAPAQTRDVGWGVVARQGDPRHAASAHARRDGAGLVYTSSSSVEAGVVLHNGDGDLYTVPFNNGRGGAATALRGASDPAVSEYYPSYSPDDRLIAFNRAPARQSSYSNPNAELYVIAAEGGTPIRLRANDPPACSGPRSPGVTNSWPKWSPVVGENRGKRYYWLTFSSTRLGDKPQIFVAPVVVDGSTATTYPALTLWNQPADEANHTAAWDFFRIK